MNWIYTWHNPRVDADAEAMASEMGDIFLRGVMTSGKGAQATKSGEANWASIRFLTFKDEGVFDMATTTQPATGETTQAAYQLPHRWRRRRHRDVRSAGQYLHLRDEPPAGRSDPQGAHGQRRLRDRADRRGRQVLLRRREHQDAVQRRSDLQVLLLPACQRDAAAAGTHAQAGDRGDQRPLRGRRAGNRHGGRHSHRAQRCGQDRPAGSEPRRSSRAPAARSAFRAWSGRARPSN